MNPNPPYPPQRFYARRTEVGHGCCVHDPRCEWGLYRADRLGMEHAIETHCMNEATAKAIAAEFNRRLDELPDWEWASVEKMRIWQDQWMKMKTANPHARA